MFDMNAYLDLPRSLSDEALHTSYISAAGHTPEIVGRFASYFESEAYDLEGDRNNEAACAVWSLYLGFERVEHYCREFGLDGDDMCTRIVRRLYATVLDHMPHLTYASCSEAGDMLYEGANEAFNARYFTPERLAAERAEREARMAHLSD